MSERISLATDTYNPELGATYFDFNMFSVMIEKIVHQRQYDSIRIRNRVVYPDDRLRTFGTLREAMSELGGWAIDLRSKRPLQGAACVQLDG